LAPCPKPPGGDAAPHHCVISLIAVRCQKPHLALFVQEAKGNIKHRRSAAGQADEFSLRDDLGQWN